MAGLVALATTFPFGTFDSNLTKPGALGTRAETRDGRVFRLCSAGAVDTVAGSLYQSAVPITAHLANTPPAVAIGDTSFSYTPGATGAAANLYEDGYLQVDTTPGQGYTYQIKGHDTITASVAFTLTLLDKVQIALTTSSRVGLMPNRYRNIVVAPTTLTASLAGIAPCIIPTTAFGWVQEEGRCSALINGTPAITAPVINSATTAGALDVWTTAAQATSALVGHAAQVGVSGKVNFVDLKIN